MKVLKAARIQKSRLFGLALATVLLVVGSRPALSQDRASPQFSVSVSGGGLPIISGRTNLSTGTRLLINVKKPWLPDAQSRLARGLAACGEDCFPATGPDGQPGIIVSVKEGKFEAGPFSFKGKELPPNTYPLEVTILADIGKATAAEIEAMRRPAYTSTIELRGPIPSAANAGEFYRSRYLLAGFLLRAGNVCDRDAKRTLEVAFRIIGTNELQAFSKSYPDMTKKWMEEGAINFNGMVMKESISGACTYMTSVRAQAEQIAKSDR